MQSLADSNGLGEFFGKLHVLVGLQDQGNVPIKSNNDILLTS